MPMTMIDAILKKTNAAEAYIMQDSPTISGPMPPETQAIARQRLMATNGTYRVLDELLRFARGEITDVSSEW